MRFDISPVHTRGREDSKSLPNACERERESNDGLGPGLRLRGGGGTTWPPNRGMLQERWRNREKEERGARSERETERMVIWPVRSLAGLVTE